MDIVSCTDTNFVIPLGVMMHSLCVNNEKEKLHFHIIVDDTVTEQQKDELRTVVPEDGTIDFYLINIENIRQYLIVKVENFPVPIYYRLLMAKILPESIHKVLYLDADIIVRHDLSELWESSLENLAIAGIPNQSDCGQYWNRLGYSKKLGYFNSGVLLLNLVYIRHNGLTEQFIEFIKKNPDKLLCPDQDALNFVLKDCKKMLPIRFDAQEGFYRNPPQSVFGEMGDFESDIQSPVIVHFTKEKPWESNCCHPLRNLYYYYKAETIWKNSDYMEHFKHKKLHKPIFVKVKLFIRKAIGMKKNNNQEKIEYKKIYLER